MKTFTNLKSALLLCLFFNIPSYAQDETDIKNSVFEFFSTMKFSGQWFLGYQNGKSKNKNYNEFELKRGYVTFEKTFNKSLSARFTQDVTIDEEGDGKGDVELRLKYIYLRYKFDSFAFFHKPFIEFGLIHRPWLEFEQKINIYRLQGKMYLERNNVASSADYGVGFFANLGGEMDDDYKKEINSNYAGKYGSIAIGVYNGGGYHALEENENKIIESRLTIRPLHEVVPGLQLSYFGLIGKGNNINEPDYNSNAGFISFESKNLILTGTYYSGSGNITGTAVDALGNSNNMTGYSIFSEIKLGASNINLFGRYDYFKESRNPVDVANKAYIIGVSYDFYKKCRLLFDFDKSESDLPGSTDNHYFEFAVEIAY
ncbi:MAG: hypothetical protein KJ571_12450 [Bacteroidetes bacterium]|nr:hypothetical protein [Bacteroidota bacterium]